MNPLKTLIVYDDTAHEYSIPDKQKIIIPSMTQLLRLTGIIGEDDFKPSPIYLVRGTDVHAMTELADDGEYLPEMLLEEYRPFLLAYERFLDEHDVEPVSREQLIFSDDHYFAGRYDRLWKVDGALVLTDIKTGFPARWHRIQLAGYETALSSDGVEVKGLSDLYLLKDGTYQFKIMTSTERREGMNTVEAMSRIYWFNHTQNFKRLGQIRKELVE